MFFMVHCVEIVCAKTAYVWELSKEILNVFNQLNILE